MGRSYQIAGAAASAWLVASPAAGADACGDLAPVEGQIQVAWISRVNDRAGAGTFLEVVRVSELRAWIDDHEKDGLRALQMLGMVNGKGRGSAAESDYKITLFDVDTRWMCRPATGVPGDDTDGVVLCEDSQQKAHAASRRGYTGCGYTLDTVTQERGVDVYRIPWESAATWGFCVLPWDRFVEGR